MNSRRYMSTLLFMAAAMIGALHGCRREVAIVPPEIRPGREPCAECGMLITHDRFAGALRSSASDSGFVLFDDLECMLCYERAHEVSARAGGCFVRDYDTRAWVDGADAHYLCADPDRMKTPMGSGIVAFSSNERARAAQDRYGGVVLEPADLRRRSGVNAALAASGEEPPSAGRSPGRE